MTEPIDRRAFLRVAAAAAAAGVLPGCRTVTTGAEMRSGPAHVQGEPLPWRNWAGNQACRPVSRTAPRSEEDVVDLLAAGRAVGDVRPVGSGHSFSALVPSAGTLITTDYLTGLAGPVSSGGEAEVFAGTRLHELGARLQREGRALPNLPDIHYPTIGGAIATSTHGTGPGFGSLSTFVEGLTLVTPSGEAMTCSRDENREVFDAARCSLGALGVVTRVRLATQPSYDLVERARFEPLDDVLEDIESRRDAHRHFEFYAFPHASLAQVIVTNEEVGTEPDGEDDPQAVYQLRDAYTSVGRMPGIGDFLYDRILRMAAGGAETTRVGPAHQVLTHDRIVRFREMEYTVPADAGPDCLRDILETIRDRDIPVIFPIEYRYVQGDDIPLSMFADRDGCSISIHQFADEDHRAYFAEIEPIFWRYEGRPHWGKLHTLESERLAALYPRWQDFREVRQGLDPDGRFLNEHLVALLGP